MSIRGAGHKVEQQKAELPQLYWVCFWSSEARDETKMMYVADKRELVVRRRGALSA
jgi:hypothetical protein